MALAEATAPELHPRRRPRGRRQPRPAARPRARHAGPSCTTRPTRPGSCSGRTSRCSGATRRGARKQAVRQARRDGRPARPPPEHRAVVRAQRAARGRPAARRADAAPATLRVRGVDVPADVEQGRARPLGRRARCTGPTRPAPVDPHSGVLPGLGSAGTDTHFYFGWYHGRMDGLAPRAARGAAPRPVRHRVRRAGRARARPTSWTRSAGPTSTGTDLFEHHACQKLFFDRTSRPTLFDSFDAWRDATQRYQAALIQLQIEDLRRLKYAPDRRLLPVLLRRRASRGHVVGARPRRVPKAGYGALRDACRPVLPMLEPRAGLVHVVSEAARRARRRRGRGRRRRPVVGRWTGDVAADGVAYIGRRRRSTRASTRDRSSLDPAHPALGDGDEPRTTTLLESAPDRGGLRPRARFRHDRRRGTRGREERVGDGESLDRGPEPSADDADRARHRTPARRSRGRPAGRGHPLLALLALGGRQEVGDGGHRRSCCSASCSPTWSATSSSTWARSSSTSTASGSATSASPSFPRTVLLWALRIGLIAAFVLHILAAASAHPDEPAGPAGEVPVARATTSPPNFASRTMRWTGVIVALFVIFHLLDLTWGTGEPGLRARRRVQQRDRTASSGVPVAIVYIVANLALGVHIFHGAWSHVPEPRAQQPAVQHRRAGRSRSRSPRSIVVGNVSFPLARRDRGGDRVSEHRRSTRTIPDGPDRREVGQPQVRREAREPGEQAEVRRHRRRHAASPARRPPRSLGELGYK